MAEIEREEELQVSVDPGKRRIPLLILLAVLLLGAAGGAWWWKMLNTYVSTENAKVVGDVTNISFRMTGRVDRVLVQEGDVVSKGQALACLDNAQYQVALDQAQAALDLALGSQAQLPYDLQGLNNTITKSRASLDSARAKVEKSELAVADAQRQMQESEQLFQWEAISRESMEQSKYRYQTSLADLKAARAELAAAEAALTDSEQKLNAKLELGESSLEAQVKSAQAALQAARLNYEYTSLNAPVDGSILKITVHSGETVSTGQQVMVLADLSSTWVVANIEENKISRVKPGQTVELRIDAYPGQVFAGKVLTVGDATQSTFAFMPIENTNGNFTKVTQKIPVKISLAGYQEVFKPGMSAVVKIKTAE